MPFGRSLLALEDAIDVLVQAYYCLARGSQLSLSTLQDMEARLRSLRSATAPHVGERASLASDTAPFHINLLEHAIEVLFRAYLSLCVQLKAGGTMPPSILVYPPGPGELGRDPTDAGNILADLAVRDHQARRQQC